MFTTCTPNKKCKPWVAGKRCQSFLGPRRVGVASRWRLDFLGHGIYINLLQIYFEHLRQSWQPSEFCDKCDKWDVRQSSVIHNMKCRVLNNCPIVETWEIRRFRNIYFSRSRCINAHKLSKYYEKWRKISCFFAFSVYKCPKIPNFMVCGITIPKLCRSKSPMVIPV